MKSNLAAANGTVCVVSLLAYSSCPVLVVMYTNNVDITLLNLKSCFIAQSCDSLPLVNIRFEQQMGGASVLTAGAVCLRYSLFIESQE